MVASILEYVYRALVASILDPSIGDLNTRVKPITATNK